MRMCAFDIWYNPMAEVFFWYADCDNQWQFLRVLRLILAYICLWQQPENWLACPNPTALVLCEVNFCSCTCFMRLRSGDSPCLLNAARALWSWMEETEGVNYGRRDLAVDYQCDGRQMDCRGEECSVIIRVRKCNWGWHFSPSNVAFLSSLWTKGAEIWYTFNLT